MFDNQINQIVNNDRRHALTVAADRHRAIRRPDHSVFGRSFALHQARWYSRALAPPSR